MLFEKLFEAIIHRHYPEENGQFIAQRLKELSEDVSQSTANTTPNAQADTAGSGEIPSPRE